VVYLGIQTVFAGTLAATNTPTITNTLVSLPRGVNWSKTNPLHRFWIMANAKSNKDVEAQLCGKLITLTEYKSGKQKIGLRPCSFTNSRPILFKIKPRQLFDYYQFYNVKVEPGDQFCTSEFGCISDYITTFDTYLVMDDCSTCLAAMPTDIAQIPEFFLPTSGIQSIPEFVFPTPTTGIGDVQNGEVDFSAYKFPTALTIKTQTPDSAGKTSTKIPETESRASETLTVKPTEKPVQQAIKPDLPAPAVTTIPRKVASIKPEGINLQTKFNSYSVLTSIAFTVFGLLIAVFVYFKFLK